MPRVFLFCLLLASAASAQTRVPWTSSTVRGTPEPPKSYVAEAVLPGVDLANVLEITTLGGHLLLLQNSGQIWSTSPALDSSELHLVLDLKLKHAALDHIFSVVPHPLWKENRQVFLTYTTGAKLEGGSKLSRFTLTATDPPVIDPASEEVLLNWRSGGHNGGHLQFGADGLLYISTGDAEVPAPPDQLNTGQDNSDLLSCILRIDIDRRDPGLPYAIPPDNPFIGKENTLPEIYAFGFRNPWKIAFDSAGRLWCGDVGWELWEMIHIVRRGGNHGWSVMEATHTVKPETLSPLAPITPPLIAHPHTEAASVTGGYVYTSPRLPALQGAYIYGDYETGKIWAVWLDPESPAGEGNPRILRHLEIADTPHKIVTFGLLPDGDLIYAHYGTPSTFHRLVPNPKVSQPADFPRLLSRTGLFSDTAAQQPAAGVYPFEIAEPMWQDGATASRFVALPQQSRIITQIERRKDGSINRSTVSWPENAVLARTVRWEGKKLETQVLHFDGEAWAGYTYRWNEAGSDAELVPPGGGEMEITAGHRHTLHSRADCLRCHTNWAGFALGFQPQQLTRIAGQPAAQAALELGLATEDFFGVSPARLAARDDASASAEDRARAWLHANCAHCHRRNGGGSVPLQVNIELPLEQTALVDAVPQRGTLGIPAEVARLIAPGQPQHSVLLPRLARFGPGHMPIIGAQLPDPEAFTTLWNWIASLPSSSSPPSPISELPSPTSVPDALRLLHSIYSGAADQTALQPELTRLARSSNTDIASLFEPFLPESERQPRLGPNPDSAAILTLQGDPAKGAALLAPDGYLASCRACHFIEGTGRDFGPDLAKVGARLTRAQLLESLLEPSKVLTPGYTAHTLETQEGNTFVGFVSAESKTELTLKLPTGESHTLPRAQVRSITPLPVSLMPAGQLQHLTPQQAADVLSYLEQLR